MKKILSIVVSSMLIGFLACASTQEVTKTTADNRPCIKNLNREGGFLIGQKCSTYQQFEHANEGIAFDNLVFVIAAEGYQIIDASKELGMMNAAKQGSYGGGKTAHLNVILIQNNGGLLRVELTLSLPAGYVAGNMEVENLFCKILMGDSSDNIGGIMKKCGIKTAQKYNDNPELFNDLLDNNPEIREKYEFNRTLMDFNCIPQNLIDEFMEANVFI